MTRDETNLLKTRAEILGRQAERKGSLDAVGIVPVRGSRADPGSIALAPLGDRTVLDWTIDAALDSERIKTLGVTTPDQDILDHVRDRYGNRVACIQRSADLARLNTHIEDTVFDALAQLDGNAAAAGAIAVLYAECPFRTARQIDMAIDMLSLFETDTVVGVRPETDIFYAHNGKGLQQVRSTNGLRLEREEIYRGAGKLYVVRRDYLEKTRKLTGGRVGHVVIEPHAAIQLTSEWEFEVARYWAGKLDADGRMPGVV